MKTKVILCILMIFVISCKSSKNTIQEAPLDYGSPNVEQQLLDDNTFVVDIYSEDGSYGFTKENPINVGNMENSGPKNERRFLNALMGPNKEPITYEREGSCCPFKTKNGLFDDTGYLDKYVITYEGLKKPIILYINMYDSDTLKIPVGFQKKR